MFLREKGFLEFGDQVEKATKICDCCTLRRVSVHIQHFVLYFFKLILCMSQCIGKQIDLFMIVALL